MSWDEFGRLFATAGADAGSARERADALEPLPVDHAVASAWAALRIALRDAGTRMPLHDSWIAATAIAHEIPVVTRDGDDDDVPGLTAVRV